MFRKTTLALTVDEAHFLRERIVTADPGSLLAHYLLAGQPVENTIALPWDGVDFNGLPDELAKRVRYGRWFSELFWGAALRAGVCWSPASREESISPEIM